MNRVKIVLKYSIIKVKMMSMKARKPEIIIWLISLLANCVCTGLMIYGFEISRGSGTPGTFIIAEILSSFITGKIFKKA